MKNKALLFVLLLSFATSCVFTDVNSPVGEPEPDDTYMSLRSSQIMLPPEVGDVESITIESLRIMIFSKATGRLITNKLFDISDLPLTTKDPDTGYWIVDFSDIVVATKPGESIVYVVLNENIMSVSSQTLTGALNMISTIADMQTLVNTPLSYTNPLRVVYDANGKPIEPPFIMSTFDEFDISPNMPKENPYIADLRGLNESTKGFALDRTMAKVTLESISSYPRYTGDPTNNLETSYIFILKVGLVNVPMQYLWSPNRLNTTPPVSPPSSPVLPAYSGAYQTIDFGLENTTTGYYDRTWNGSITATATANVEWTQYGKGNIYKIEDNAGVKSYGTDINQAIPYDTPQPTNWNKIINSGNFMDFLMAYFSDGGGQDFDLGNIEFSNTQITPLVTPDYWILNEKNISYYVPEHILSDKTNSTNATKLHVRASIASMPDFNPDDVHFSEDEVNWEMENGQIKWTYMTITENFLRQSFRSAPHPTVPGKYMYYWTGNSFWRKARGTVTLDLGNVDFAHITDGDKIKDFYLPIQNTPTIETPTDYNIYRNHEYKFSVHVLKQWAATTRSETASQEKSSMVLRYNDK